MPANSGTSFVTARAASAADWMMFAVGAGALEGPALDAGVAADVPQAATRTTKARSAGMATERRGIRMFG
jgi:hypothetical protein